MGNEVKCSKGAASFLKVVDGEFSKHMIIPPTFSKNFNGIIPPWFIIEIGRTRKCWRVDVECDENGGFKITNGWNDFVETQALKLGDFLVFQYKRNLSFEVTVYDRDGSEKTAGQTSEFEKYNFEDFEHQHRISKTSHVEGDDATLVDQANQDSKPEVVGSIKRKMPSASMTGSGACFSVTWKGARKFNYVTIPKELVLEKKLSNKMGMLLMDEEGKSWLVKLATWLDGRVNFTQGLREYLDDNKVRAGDTLTFEFISDNLVQVHAERPFVDDHPSQSKNRCKSKPPRSSNLTCEPAGKCTVNYKSPEALGNTGVYPAFVASSYSKTVTMYSIGANLYIPMKVVKEQNLHNKKTIVLCDEEGKHWDCEIHILRSGSRVHVSLASGWNEFKKRYKIMVGDTLNFKFVAECMMKVNIIRASQVHCVAKEEAAVKQEMMDIN